MNPSPPPHPGPAAALDHIDYDGIDPDVYHRRWKTLAVLCSSLMIVIVGNTVLNVALPRLQDLPERGGIGASNSEIQWIVDAYALVFAGLLFTAAALGDRFGRKGALQIGLVIFGLGSLLGALGDSASGLIASRAIMGVGAAFVMPSTLSILTNVFPTRERAKAIAIWAGISGGGAAFGPLASGLLLEHFWWGSVFLINLPIIVAAIVAGNFLVPRSKDATESPLDPAGALLSILGLGALVYAIIEAPHHGWLSVESLVWFGAAAVFLVGFCAWELRTAHPMLDLRLFRSSRFAVASGGITLTFFAMFGAFFLVTQYFQLVLEYSPLGAAVRLLPMSLIMMAIAPQTPRLVARVGANVVGFVGLLFVAIGLGGSALFDADTSYPQVLATVAFLASGMALTMTPMTTQLMASVPRDRAGMGSATNDTTRELGGALGVAVLGSLVAGQYSSGVASALADVPADVAAAASGSLGGAVAKFVEGQLPFPALEAARDAFVDGFSLAMVVAASVVAVAAFLVLKLLPSDRQAPDVSGEGHEEVEVEAVAVAGD